jgi:hypothetical protein
VKKKSVIGIFAGCLEIAKKGPTTRRAFLFLEVIQNY